MNKKNENYETYHNEQLQIESLLSAQNFDKKNLQKQLGNTGSYGGSDSQSWLLSVAQSLVATLIVMTPKGHEIDGKDDGK